ncbi:UvrD-helicase domain-containing protein [Mammaliicoccus sciuri]|uniref:UvrD-helicase domain-containing protein n=1 Tax=Mammaliicoccus sciuri TaxID=1296 RepID=UPI002737ED71|nr:UvrD-helicase domain-containing protein [Mammaliicoccus sciuri]
MFSNEEYDLVEKILLNGNHFNSQQREFIELFESKTIVAVPGAGKTTSLAAKIILLLRYLNNSNSREGVCIITHTNIAVNEINIALQKAGIKNISHPHFIGTIHEFFNRFCLIPYFKNEYGNNTIVFESLESNDLDYYRRFIKNQIPWIKDPKYEWFLESISKKIINNTLFFDKKNNVIDMHNNDNWYNFDKYKKIMIQAKMSRKVQGFLNFDDTFMFSQIFLQDTKFQEILRKRFKYVFIDEFQDTTLDGLELLNKIFNKPENIIQLIGDPYQTIMYNQPMPKLYENQLFRMNLSNRFGKEISLILNRIINDANIQVHHQIKSFKPIILIYHDEQSIYQSYKNILQEYEIKNTSFKECDKGDKVLIRNKKWASRIKKGAVYAQKNNSKSIPKNIQLKNLITDFIYNIIIDEKLKVLDLRKWIIEHPKIDELNNILLDVLKFGLNDNKKKQIRDIINYILTEKNRTTININNSLFKRCECILQSNASIGHQYSNEIDDIHTIHSVKGETLRSVLVVNFDDGPFVDILLHQYGLKDELNYSNTDKNILYVALSRVSFLNVFAIHEDALTQESISILEKDWEIRNIN